MTKRQKRRRRKDRKVKQRLTAARAHLPQAAAGVAVVTGLAGQLSPARCEEVCASSGDEPGIVFGYEFDLEPIPTRANVYPVISFQALAGSATVGTPSLDRRFHFVLPDRPS